MRFTLTLTRASHPHWMAVLGHALPRVAGVVGIVWPTLSDEQLLRAHLPEELGRVLVFDVSFAKCAAIDAFTQDFIARPKASGLILPDDQWCVLADYLRESLEALPECESLYMVCEGWSACPPGSPLFP